MLPCPIFDYINCGAEDEVALRRSTAAFDRYELLPRMLTDVSPVSTETEIFGHRIPFLLILSPTGLTRLFHHDAELAVAQAARTLRWPGATVDTPMAGKRQRNLLHGRLYRPG